MNISQPEDHHQGGISSPIDQLHAVMEDIEMFMTDWFQRLEKLHALPVAPDEKLLRRIREFQQERNQWEAKRKRESEDLTAKAEELGKAWIRLEDEQRKFLQTRDSQSRGKRAAAAPEPSNVETEEVVTAAKADAGSIVTEERRQPEAACAAQPATASHSDESDRRRSPLQGSRAGATAVLQFQQLRREIETNRHQRQA